MELIDIANKEIMHIDTSGKLYEQKDTGVAYKTTKSLLHKGMGLSLKLKKELERDLSTDHDFARLYSICIYYLIKEEFDKFEILVICNDEYPVYVKLYLDLLFAENNLYSKKQILSIGEFRVRIDNPHLKSFANNIANSYRKRALKNQARQQSGTKLNIVHINYRLISEKWNEIDEKLKK